MFRHSLPLESGKLGPTAMAQSIVEQATSKRIGLGTEVQAEKAGKASLILGIPCVVMRTIGFDNIGTANQVPGFVEISVAAFQREMV